MPVETRSRVVSLLRNFQSHPYARSNMDVASPTSLEPVAEIMMPSILTSASSSAAIVPSGPDVSNVSDVSDNLNVPVVSAMSQVVAVESKEAEKVDSDSDNEDDSSPYVQLIRTLKAGIENVEESMSEGEFERGIDPSFCLDTTDMNNPLMQISNEHGVVLKKIRVEKSIHCCDRWSESYHPCTERCDYRWYAVTVYALDSLHLKMHILNDKHRLHVEKGNSGALIDASGHHLKDALKEAMKQFRDMVVCGDCGNLFQRRMAKSITRKAKNKVDAIKQTCCHSCMLQAMLTPTRKIDCTICMESTGRFVTLPCSHSFHAKCFLQLPLQYSVEAQETGRKCPNCRAICTRLPI